MMIVTKRGPGIYFISSIRILIALTREPRVARSASMPIIADPLSQYDHTNRPAFAMILYVFIIIATDIDNEFVEDEPARISGQ